MVPCATQAGATLILCALARIGTDLGQFTGPCGFFLVFDTVNAVISVTLVCMDGQLVRFRRVSIVLVAAVIAAHATAVAMLVLDVSDDNHELFRLLGRSLYRNSVQRWISTQVVLSLARALATLVWDKRSEKLLFAGAPLPVSRVHAHTQQRERWVQLEEGAPPERGPAAEGSADSAPARGGDDHRASRPTDRKATRPWFPNPLKPAVAPPPEAAGPGALPSPSPAPAPPPAPAGTPDVAPPFPPSPRPLPRWRASWLAIAYTAGAVLYVLRVPLSDVDAFMLCSNVVVPLITLFSVLALNWRNLDPLLLRRLATNINSATILLLAALNAYIDARFPENPGSYSMTATFFMLCVTMVCVDAMKRPIPRAWRAYMFAAVAALMVVNTVKVHLLEDDAPLFSVRGQVIHRNALKRSLFTTLLLLCLRAVRIAMTDRQMKTLVFVFERRDWQDRLERRRR